MQRNCYGREEVENLRRQVKEVFVPFAEKLYERRKERLGLETMTWSDEQVFGPEAARSRKERRRNSCGRPENVRGTLSGDTGVL